MALDQLIELYGPIHCAAIPVIVLLPKQFQPQHQYIVLRCRAKPEPDSPYLLPAKSFRRNETIFSSMIGEIYK